MDNVIFKKWYVETLNQVWDYRLNESIDREWFEMCAKIRDFLKDLNNSTEDEIDDMLEQERNLCLEYWLHEQTEFLEYADSFTEGY